MAEPLILTNVGLAKLASATPEDQLKIASVAVGDGNGGYPPLDPTMTALVNEVWRGTASAPIRDQDNDKVLIFETIIPADDGGFFIREIGLFDDDGDMIAIGQTGVVEKPTSGSGTPITMTVRVRLALANASQTDLIINDAPYIDHQATTNRSAPDAHPIESITGLRDELDGKADSNELGTAAYRNLTENSSDIRPGRVLKVGDFGIGSRGGLRSIGSGFPLSSCNQADITGLYAVNTSAVDKPEGSVAGWLIVDASNSTGYFAQTFLSNGSAARRWERRCFDGVFTTWVEHYHTGNFDPGTAANIDVGQLPDQIPTNADLFKNADLTVTVGSGGDFTTINAALAHLSRFTPLYKNNGISADIMLLSGFVMAEQVFVRGIDLGWITIKSEDDEVPIQRSALTEAIDGNRYPAFCGVQNAVLPTINALFNMDSSGTATYRHGIHLFFNSAVTVLSGCGIKNAGSDALNISRGSRASAQNSIFTGAGRNAIAAHRGSFVDATGAGLSGAGLRAVYASMASMVNVAEAELGGGQIDSQQGALVNADGATGVSQTLFWDSYLATAAEAQALENDFKALTPKKLGDSFNENVFAHGQSRQNVTDSRVLGTIYTNTTKRPITVTVIANITGDPNNSYVALYVDENLAALCERKNVGVAAVSAVVPPGIRYRANIVAGTLTSWIEYR